MFFNKRMTRKLNRNRLLYGIFIIITIALGLASRMFKTELPDFIGLYVGDVLWALMIFFIIGFIFNKLSILLVAVIALLLAYGIEVSQLYSATWIDNIRATSIGALILGRGFLWSDIICYTMGILLGMIGEYKSYKLDFLFI